MSLADDLWEIADRNEDMNDDQRATLRRAADALEWRRVEDGLPDSGAIVNVACEDGFLSSAKFDRLQGKPYWTVGFTHLNPSVSRWQPILPPAPERKEQKA